MAVYLSDHGKPEPGLLEAVKVVIKYEIQSLLTKLADTGEEYLVLTASTLDNSCGHIGSIKGECFVKTPSLQLIKEEFLNFCTGDETNQQADKIPVTENVQDSTIISKENPQPNRNRRRKSTPRCKSQPPEWQTQQELQEIQNYAMFSEADSPTVRNLPEENKQDLSHEVNGYPMEEPKTENGHVLDLSDKNVTGYSYTLDCSSDSYGSNIMSSSSDVSKYPSKEISPKHNGVGEEVPAYTWREEKIPMNLENARASMLEYVNDIPFNFTNYREGSSVDTGFFDSPHSIMKKEIIAESMKKPANLSQGGIRKEQQPQQRNRRKSRKTPLKANIKGESGDSTSPLSAKDNHKINTNGLSGNFTDITDMKSAFQEIGNMAKCLICFKVLANKNNRTFHWRSHVGDKRFTCDICNKAFTHPSNMRSHRKIHTDEKPFPCELCDRRFRRRDYLLQHLERFHLNPRSSDSTLMDESSKGGTGVPAT